MNRQSVILKESALVTILIYWPRGKFWRLVNYMRSKLLTTTTLALLLLLTFLPMANPNAATASASFQNPSVISGSAAALNGPRVNTMKFTIYTDDTAALGSVLSGTNQIMDLTPSIFSDVQTALNTKFLNVTSQAGAEYEDLKFNMVSPSDAGYYLPFRQAMAHLINYTYIQNTVLSGVQGIATPALFLPSAFVGSSPTTFTIYSNSLAAATASLGQDPQIAWSATDKQPASSNTIACNGGTGVWEYATSLGSGKPNGTVFEPQLITRPDHATWFTWAQEFWNSAAQIGLCINLRQVVHYSSVAPIIYNGYSSGWDMYDGGQSFSGILDATGNAYFTYSSAGFPGGPQFNTEHFSNATIDSLLKQAYYTTNGTLAGQLTTQAVSLAPTADSCSRTLVG